MFEHHLGPSDLARMTCLEIINYAVYNHGLDADSLSYLKQALLEYVRQTYGPDAQNETDQASHSEQAHTNLDVLVCIPLSEWVAFIPRRLPCPHRHRQQRQQRQRHAVLSPHIVLDSR